MEVGDGGDGRGLVKLIEFLLLVLWFEVLRVGSGGWGVCFEGVGMIYEGVSFFIWLGGDEDEDEVLVDCWGCLMGMGGVWKLLVCRCWGLCKGFVMVNVDKGCFVLVG